MRLATWNVNSLKARLPAVTQWVNVVRPDVLCMQETKLAADAFPFSTFADLGYETAHHGNGAWNGVAICSRVGLDDVVRGFPGEPSDSECRCIRAVCGGVSVLSTYVPNGRIVDSEHYEAKLAWLEGLLSFVAGLIKDDRDLVVCGDFNIAPTDLDVFDPAAFEGATHVTAPERALLQRLFDLGLVDAVRAHYPGTERLFSWWDYRRGDFHKGRGMRIDLVLASPGLVESSTWALIDRNARKGQGSKTAPQPSDHAPVVVEFS